MTREGWLAAMGLAESEIPDLVVLEGSWWRRERNAVRLPALEDARELAFPEWHLGRHRGRPVLYSCVYGAPRAVEPVHVLGELGTPAVVQIGSCGGLADGVLSGDIVVVDRAAIGEGASRYYGGEGSAAAAPALADAAEKAFADRGFRVHRGSIVTTSALFAQPPELVGAWREAGHLAVDMETSAVLTAARRFGMAAASMLFVWDEVARDRSFLDTYTPAEQEAQARADAALLDVALEVGLDR
ncbi:MAG: hypothetical protein ACRDZ9_06010 [Acidimicrobiales bacterium]